MLMATVSPPINVNAQQEVCPEGGGWIKIEPLSGYSYAYTAPEGKLIIATCAKAGTWLNYEYYDPPVKTVTIISAVQQELSHVSVNLIDDPNDPTTTPSATITPSATATLVPSATPTPPSFETVTPTDTGEPTKTLTPPPTPQNTPTDPPAGGESPSFIAIGTIIGSVISLLAVIYAIIERRKNARS